MAHPSGMDAREAVLPRRPADTVPELMLMRRGGHTRSRVVVMVTWGLMLALGSIMSAQESAPRLSVGVEADTIPAVTSVRRALVIAANRCAEPRLPEARLAVPDGRWFYEKLLDPGIGRFSPSECSLLAGDDATLPRIREELARLQNASPEDVVVIYFAAYVANERGQVYWATRESVAGSMGDTSLSHAELNLLLKAIPSQRVVVILDGYDGSVAGPDTPLTRADLAGVLPSLACRGRTVLAFEDDGTHVINSGGIRHGVLAQSLVEGLGGAADGNGDGSVSVAEMWRSVVFQISKELMNKAAAPARSLVLNGEGFQADRVYFTVNPHPESINRGRLEALAKLLGRGEISGSEYDEARRLLSSRLLRERERQQRDIYADLADGRSEPEAARGALAVLASSRPSPKQAKPVLGTLPPLIRNSLRMDMVLIPDGDFRMGSSVPADALSVRFGGPPDWFGPEFPLHRVRVSRPFYMSTCEVTIAKFRTFVEETGYRTDGEKGGQSFEDGKKGGYTVLRNKNWGWRDGATWRNPGFDQTENDPVVMISWNDADMFCKWLSARDNRDYRLPTEAEWEYACRAGGTTLFWWGDSFDSRDDNENGEFTRLVSWWMTPDRPPRTYPVGKFRANAFGLYDMAGNVWEWCNDWYDRAYYSDSPTLDPQGPGAGLYRVIRGGAWHDSPRYCRSSCRNGYRPAGRHGLIGFRIVAEAR